MHTSIYNLLKLFVYTEIKLYHALFVACLFVSHTKLSVRIDYLNLEQYQIVVIVCSLKATLN